MMPLANDELQVAQPKPAKRAQLDAVEPEEMRLYASPRKSERQKAKAQTHSCAPFVYLRRPAGKWQRLTQLLLFLCEMPDGHYQNGSGEEIRGNLEHPRGYECQHLIS
jgi:hypothetical protein